MNKRSGAGRSSKSGAIGGLLRQPGAFIGVVSLKDDPETLKA